MSLVSELRRRNVFRMAALYVVAAWLSMQVAEVLIDLAHLPDWIGPATLGLLAVGFPIALIFSWFYELTPEGLSLEREIVPGESITHITGRRMDFVVIALLSAAVILFAYDKWWPSSPPEYSIAVLPFANLSDESSNEYFSDGISEELLTLLAKAPKLTVTSRSSAFSFKNKDVAIPVLARQLNVAHVLDGSVRKEGNRVRITARLVEARSDSHVWSETYDRTLGDIFAIQNEIAGHVVEQLKVALGADEREAIAHVQRPTENLEAYELYLRGRHLWQRRGEDNIRRAIDLFKKATALDPQFARAWSSLAAAHSTLPAWALASRDEQHTEAASNARKALILDNSLAEAYAVLGDIARLEGEWLDAETHFINAIASEPENSTARLWYGEFLLTVGRLHDALDELSIAHRFDPLSVAVNGVLASAYWQLDDEPNALKFGAAAADLGNSLGPKIQMLVHVRHGDFDQAMEFAAQRGIMLHDLQATPTNSETLFVEAKMNETKKTAYLDFLAQNETELDAWVLIPGYARFDQMDDAYRIAQMKHNEVIRSGRVILWQPDMASFRKDPRFAQLVSDIGLIVYWRERSWPDACRPVGESVICN